jgi:hypothetical protein
MDARLDLRIGRQIRLRGRACRDEGDGNPRQ